METTEHYNKLGRQEKRILRAEYIEYCNENFNKFDDEDELSYREWLDIHGYIKKEEN